MSDFKFLKDLSWNKWVVLDPRRSKRPNQSKQVLRSCPFCIGSEEQEKDVYRVGGNPGDSNWQIRVLKNKFSFAPVHEIIIHSPDHHKNIDELPASQVELLFTTYKERIAKHKSKGQVYVFHNRGELAGESLPHPHSQLIAAPKDVFLDIRPLIKPDGETLTTNFFTLFSPITSQWPDEVWIVPKRSGKSFDKIYEEEIIDLSFIMQRLLRIMSIRYKEDFPYNFYIAPGNKWYIRFIPRIKIIGGFEVGTGIWVNTQDPKETYAFLKNHFEKPNEELIRREHTAEYRKHI